MDIYQIFEDIVDAIRDTASITGITDNANGTYTVLTADTKDLANDDYVSISDTTGFNESNYKISTLVSNTSFNITKTAGVSIPISFGTWKANAPYSDYGRWVEKDKDLMEKGESNTYKNQMFDLVFMLIPIDVGRKKKVDGIIKVPNLNIYFFTSTNETKNTRWRKENNYSTLENLSIEFVNELSKRVTIGIELTDTFIPYMQGIEFVFTTPVDAWMCSFDELIIGRKCN